MKIGIVGYGRMGRMIRNVALENGNEVIAVIDPVAKVPEVTSAKLSLEALQDCQAVIDFSVPACAVDHILLYARAGIPAVIGTTGWYGRLEEIQSLVKDMPDCAIVWSGNFSIGVHLFFEIVSHAASLISQFDEYDVLAHEMHHAGKADSPSGTAKMLGDILLRQMSGKDSVETARLDRKRLDSEIHISSSRGGYFPGTHEVYFDSPVDTITISHAARNREGFARGAVRAAAWVADGRKGFFSLDDMMSDLLPSQ